MNKPTVKTVRFHQTGDASVLDIEQLPLSEPGEHEVRLKVEALGLNRAEVMFRNGAYIDTPELPARIGYEASGVVDAIGPGVSEFKIGDRVSTIPAFSMSQYGVYGESAVVPVHAVAASPENFSAEQSTSIWMQYLTAYGALVELADLQAGQYLLVTAASSSVGVAAIQLGKSLGAVVIATTRGSAKVDFLTNQGADHVIQTDSQDLVARSAEITGGQGVNLVFDPVGGPLLEQLAQVSAPAATIIEYGALDNRPTPYPLFTALSKGLTIRGYTLFEFTADKKRLAQAKAALLPLFEEGQLVPVIDKVFAFNDIRDAHRYMESNQQMGKIVVKV
ncbi:zinc-dependent alcohol dehydrogenase family protein [Thalassomonas actiniarum]|uniref:Zinc-dependent alcohol dehydrogenase family protein n=1 Tax=Thalassomonas actiniarum TaxID=485447 RepID=A0AAF0C289_9GAMM|nr:zinc-dependent alcohol dehydrogenase family protein [Thalassomonas actiniarum]WDD97509.1 zinc-dependent alcohol dehydrogenase family protein [Thalassomonas actiniarum]